MIMVMGMLIIPLRVVELGVSFSSRPFALCPTGLRLGCPPGRQPGSQYSLAMQLLMTLMTDVLTKMMAGVWMMGVSDGGVMDLMTGEYTDALTDDGPLGPAQLRLMEEWEWDEEVKKLEEIGGLLGYGDKGLGTEGYGDKGHR